jgi:serine protein kinase
MMAQFSVLSRLKEPENSSLFSKMQVYDGENLKDTDPKAKSYQEYRDYAGVDEGMNGISTLCLQDPVQVFNFDTTEVAANPVHLMYVLEQQIEREQFPPETEQKYSPSSRTPGPRYAEFIGKEIQTAYLESYSSTARTSSTATSPMPTSGSRTRNTAITTPARSSTARRSTRAGEDREAGRHQQPQGLPQRDRQLRAARAGQQRGKNPLDQLRKAARGDREEDVLQHRRPAAGDRFNAKASPRKAEHEDFVNRMVSKGYTPKQVRLLCEWYLRVRKSS